MEKATQQNVFSLSILEPELEQVCVGFLGTKSGLDRKGASMKQVISESPKLVSSQDKKISSNAQISQT